MMKFLCWLICLCLLNLIYLGLTQNAEPAMKVIVTAAGISRITNISKKIAIQELPNLHLPTISGEAELTIGKVHYEAWNIKIIAVLELDFKVSMDNLNSLLVTVYDAGVLVSGQWKFELKNIFHIHDEGTLMLSAKKLKLETKINIGTDSRGMPIIQATECSGMFNDISIEIHSSLSWIINKFKDNIVREINKPCDILKDSVMSEIARILNQHSPQISIGHNIDLDIRLLEAPKINEYGLTFVHKGEFFYQGDTSEAPFQPNPMPDIKSNKMLEVETSEYMFNTLSYITHEHGMQEGTITRENLPESYSGLLNTTCTKFLCIGFIIPQLGYSYPNTFVEINYNTTNFPQLQLNTSGASSTMTNIYTFRTRLQDKSQVELFTLSANITLNMILSIENHSPTLHWKIINFRMNTSLVDSKIGWIPNSAASIAIEWIIRLVAIPKIDKQGTLGKKLPLPNGFQLDNLKFHFMDGYAFIEGDFDYQVS